MIEWENKLWEKIEQECKEAGDKVQIGLMYEYLLKLPQRESLINCQIDKVFGEEEFKNPLEQITQNHLEHQQSDIGALLNDILKREEVVDQKRLIKN